MVDYKYADLFLNDSVDKQMHIYYDNGAGHITNSDLYSQEFELQESLSSSTDLKFGACESSSITFKIANSFIPLKGKVLRVEQVLNGNTDEPFVYGTYKVESDVPTADRYGRTVTAYDALYEVLNEDMYTWFNTNFPKSFTLKQLRNKFFEHFGIEQEEIDLPNDNIQTSNALGDIKTLTGRDIITALCELNGCFGHIGRDSKFHYIFFKEIVEGLYPANDLYPQDDLYPKDEQIDRIVNKRHYITATYEDYECQAITQVKIYNKNNEVLASRGSNDVVYNISDNILAYGLTNANAQTVIDNTFEYFTRAWYMPATVDKIGDPCLEVGDTVRLVSRNKIVYTFVLQRNIRGIQALRDNFEATGNEVRVDDTDNLKKQVRATTARTERLQSGVDTAQSTANTAQSTANTANSTASSAKTTADDAVKRVGTIESDYVKATRLNADVANLGYTKITTADVDNLIANNATVKGKLSASDVTANYIAGKFTTGNSANFPWISCTNIKCSSGVVFDYEGATRTFAPKTININGTNYRVLAN